MKPRIFIIDSDRIACCSLVKMLRECHFDCIYERSGLNAIRLLEEQSFNLIIMDQHIEDMSGFFLLRQIILLRQAPVIMLSRDNSEYNRIRAFDEGVTDFVSKPIIYRGEFIWRIQAILRRSLRQQILLTRIQINLLDKTVRCDGQQINLTHQLFQLLVTLASKPGQVVERDDILSCLDNGNFSTSDNQLYVLAHRLRQHLEYDSNQLPLLYTIRGVGYLLNDS